MKLRWRTFSCRPLLLVGTYVPNTVGWNPTCPGSDHRYEYLAIVVVLVVKNPSANAGDIRDMGLIPGLRRSPGGGHGNPLQYSCLEKPHGQSSLVGSSPWACKELDTTEVTWHAGMPCVNGSCSLNPRLERDF